MKKLKVKSFAEQATNQQVKQLLESADDGLELETTGDETADLNAAVALAVANQKPATEAKKESVDDKSTSSAGSTPSTMEKLMESMQTGLGYLMEKEKAREKQETIRNVLDSFDMNFADLTPDRQQLLRDSKDEEAMKRLVSTWPPVVRRRQSSSPPASSGLTRESHNKPADNIQELRKRLTVA